MKIKIGKYTIDINENSLVKSKKANWVNSRVKSLDWTGISKDVLEEKFSEVYDIIKGTDDQFCFI